MSASTTSGSHANEPAQVTRDIYIGSSGSQANEPAHVTGDRYIGARYSSLVVNPVRLITSMPASVHFELLGANRLSIYLVPSDRRYRSIYAARACAASSQSARSLRRQAQR